jgi:hypothetical protein
VICTDVFELTARVQARALGVPETGIVIVPHPFSGVDPVEVKRKATAAIDRVIAALVEPARSADPGAG